MVLNENLGTIIFALSAILMPTARAANPIDLVAAPLQQIFNTSPEQLEKKALEHISQG